jgi:arabinan endo-1,5-alpha-L-arabinosidase
MSIYGWMWLMILTRNRNRWRALCGTAVAMTLGMAFAPQPAIAAAPRPVYAPADGVADPGVVTSGGDFWVFATGSRAPMSRGVIASGPWSAAGPALTSTGSWAVAGGAVWAPDAVKTPAGWVLYYSAPAIGLGGQRCIGVAISTTGVDGPYNPAVAPLICPGGAHGAQDRVPGRPVADAGVIDPSPFEASDGKRYVLYKTQQTPSSLRMLRVNATGTQWTGENSGELIRNAGIIENPVMVQRGNSFILFASRYGYDNCSYASVWLRSSSRWNFAGAAERPLLSTPGTGICGPGGADIVPALDGGTRIFIHGWVCGNGTTACRPADAPFTGPHRRVLYAAILTWGADGATPTVGALL